jgi:mRNA interferase MazF
MNLGDVVLIKMQFLQSAGSKVRPAVVVLDAGDDDFIAAPVTSQLRSSNYDLTLEDWTACGLNVTSHVRAHKLTVLSKSEIVRTLGRLTDRDRVALIAVLCRTFCPRP